MNDFVTIHGDQWEVSDIEDSIKWAQEQEWKKMKWLPRASLESKGKSSEYVGQKFNPEYTKLVEDGWTHDHCEICWWSLYESDEPDTGFGYTIEGRSWLCSECHELFILAKA